MTTRPSLRLVGLCLLAGLVGMALFQSCAVVYQDWAFVHRVRLLQEYQLTHPTTGAPQK